MKNFHIIVATDLDRGIGYKGQLPWHLPEDLVYFKKLTTTSTPGLQNMVIMGRKTWESLPESVKPLPGRINAILSHNTQLLLPKDTLKFASLDAALEYAEQTPKIDQCFVIGGGQLYEEAIRHPWLDTLSITLVETHCNCDTFFPEYEHTTRLVTQTPTQMSKSGVGFRILEWVKV